MSAGEAPAVLLRMPALPDAVGVARQALTGACEALGLDARATGDVRLAVSEACTNVVAHATATATSLASSRLPCCSTRAS